MSNYDENNYSDNDSENEMLLDDMVDHLSTIDDVHSIDFGSLSNNMPVEKMETELRRLNNSLENIIDDDNDALITRRELLLIQKEELEQNLKYLKVN